MKINCKWNDKTGKAEVEFLDLTDDYAAIEFIRDCLCEIEIKFDQLRAIEE